MYQMSDIYDKDIGETNHLWNKQLIKYDLFKNWVWYKRFGFSDGRWKLWEEMTLTFFYFILIFLSLIFTFLLSINPIDNEIKLESYYYATVIFRLKSKTPIRFKKKENWIF